jgi:MoxR-like ATPase
MATAEQRQRHDLPRATLDASQRAFVDAASIGQCCVLAGPAGCGKTTAVSAAASALQGGNPSSKRGDRSVKPSKVVKLCLFRDPALTMGFLTIHRFFSLAFGQWPSRENLFHHVRGSPHVRSCVLACQVIFLDEVYSLSIHSFEDTAFVFSQFPLPGMERLPLVVAK